MICPGWQYPHCSTCSASHAFWTGWPPSGERPSMVVTRLPSTARIRVTQDRVAWPSRCTVQEPHIAIPQPYFVPVSLSFSRSTHSNVSSGCTATSICLPLSMKIMRTSPEPATLIPPPGSLVYWLTAMDIKGLTGAETLLRVLAAMGVERIFASPGSEWAPIWEHLAKPYGSPHEIPRYMSSRHEEIAVGMASGYTKATGKLPAVMIHTTVGALHATMALRAAMHEHVPMVVLAGESIGFGEIRGPDPGHQWLRVLADTGGPARLVADCVKWSFGLNTSALLPATIQRACQLAMAAPQGPVFVSVPMEFLFETMSTNPPAVASFPSVPAALPSAIADLARLLAAAANPVIVTEEAGRTVRGVEHLVALAERLGAPVVEGWHPAFVNFPRQHPLYGGIGGSAHLAGYLKDADLVFLAAAVAPWHPPSSAPGPSTKVVALSDDPAPAGDPPLPRSPDSGTLRRGKLRRPRHGARQRARREGGASRPHGRHGHRRRRLQLQPGAGRARRLPGAPDADAHRALQQL